MLKKLIEFTLASATIKEMQTEKGHKTRGTINLWINSPYGTGKTSTMLPLVENKLGVIIQDYSMPGLIGTIRSRGIATIGDIRLLKNTTALLEEFQNTKQKERAVMLSLMEDHRYSRTLGFEVLKPEKIIEDGFGFIAEGTRIEIFLQASFIVFSMTFRTSTTLELALISRCIPVFLETAREEQSSLFVDGKTLNINAPKIKRIREELKGTTIVVPEKTRREIAEKYKGLSIKPENLTRAMWDFTRVAFLQSYMDGANEITKESIDQSEWLLKIQELGYAKRTLTRTAYEVFLFLQKQDKPMRTAEIADKLRLSREYCARILAQLVEKGLVYKTRISKEVVYHGKSC